MRNWKKYKTLTEIADFNMNYHTQTHPPMSSATLAESVFQTGSGLSIKALFVVARWKCIYIYFLNSRSFLLSAENGIIEIFKVVKLEKKWM